jgi:hypothetical protein
VRRPRPAQNITYDTSLDWIAGPNADAACQVQQPLTDPDDRRFDADDKRQAAELIELDGELRREPLARKATFGVAAEAGREIDIRALIG